jgi:hypothetical protein
MKQCTVNRRITSKSITSKSDPPHFYLQNGPRVNFNFHTRKDKVLISISFTSICVLTVKKVQIRVNNNNNKNATPLNRLIQQKEHTNICRFPHKIPKNEIKKYPEYSILLWQNVCDLKWWKFVFFC